MIKLLSMVTALLVLYSSQAGAYQYGAYAPSTYNAPRYYYNPYQAPYYPAYRYPAQQRSARYTAPSSVPAVKNRPVQKSHTDKSKTAAASAQSVTQQSGNSNKQGFVTTLLPYIEKENKRLLALREDVRHVINKIQHKRQLTMSEKQQLQKLTKSYRVEGDVLSDSSARDELVSKIDVIPSSLALAQAANESAWGKSRFATEANNLFGIWTYDKDKGLKPKNREQGKKHLVRIFDDVGDSVSYYMHTLNSHPAYKELRSIRQQLRADNLYIDGHELAAGLEKYSARGQEYIDIIQRMIRQNEWALLDTGNHQA